MNTKENRNTRNCPGHWDEEGNPIRFATNVRVDNQGNVTWHILKRGE